MLIIFFFQSLNWAVYSLDLINNSWFSTDGAVLVNISALTLDNIDRLCHILRLILHIISYLQPNLDQLKADQLIWLQNISFRICIMLFLLWWKSENALENANLPIEHYEAVELYTDGIRDVGMNLGQLVEHIQVLLGAIITRIDWTL